MIIAKVVGNVISTRKNSKLTGIKFLIVEPVDGFAMNGREKMVVADNIGAGIGDTVLLACGSAARIGLDAEDIPVDASVIGIIDDENI